MNKPFDYYFGWFALIVSILIMILAIGFFTWWLIGYLK